MVRGHAFWIIAAGAGFFFNFLTDTSSKLHRQEHLVFQRTPTLSLTPPPPKHSPTPHTLLTLVTHNPSLLRGGIRAARDLLISQHAPLAFLTSFCHSLLLLESQVPPASIHSDTPPTAATTTTTYPPPDLSVVSTSQVSGLIDRRHLNRLRRNRTGLSKSSQSFD